MTDIMRPFININGTSHEELVQQRVHAREGLLIAIEAMKGLRPNGRDYTGQPDGFQKDFEIWAARKKILEDLNAALLDEAITIKWDKQD
jgi:hypothetical protein